MPDIYLTPAAINYLTQVILALVIVCYFSYHTFASKDQNPPSPHTPLLLGIFVSVLMIVLLFFGDAALPPSSRLYAVYLENTVIGLFLTILTQFAYRFPRLYPQRRWEARLALAVNLLYTLWEAGFAVYRGRLLLQEHQVLYRPAQPDYVLIACLAWAPLAFLRQAVAVSQAERDQAGLENPSGLSNRRRLRRPQNQAGQAVRAFALVFLIPVGLGLINIGRATFIIPTAVFQSSMSAGILLTQFAFASVYLDYLPETTSFQVRLVGITLVTVLAVFGAVGWVMTPAHATLYRPAITDHQTLRFTPNARGGYDVTPAEFHFADDLGNPVDLKPWRPLSGPLETAAAIPFTFPFFGQTGQTVWVMCNGVVSIDGPVDYRDMEYHYATTPAIFPLFVSMVLPNNVFARVEEERLTLTWYQAPAFYNPQARFTFQVVLHRDGVFEITYAGLPDWPYQSEASPFANVWVVGALPGLPGQAPQMVDFTQLPLQGGPQGILQDHYLTFRRYLHQSLLPLAHLILVGSLVVIVGFPVAFYLNLIKPLNMLLAGVKQVEAGNLETIIPVQYHDEIGFLTQAFNSMVARLHELVTGLDLRVAERTQQLSQRNIELLQARDAAEAANQAKSIFLANMSHELRTPLTAIMGFSEMLAHDPQLTPDQKKWLGIINSSGEHLLTIINDVLMMAKIEAGRLTLQERAFDLPDLLYGLVELFRLRAAEKRLVLLLEAAPDLPQHVVADASKFRQILINLLGNAVKFTNEGSITLRAYRAPDTQCHHAPAARWPLRCEVEDTGPGIDPADLENIFEPFMQSDSALVQEGTGLGLAISRKFARLMGGELVAANVGGTPGRGALFTLDLPVRLASEQERAELLPTPCRPPGRLAPGQLAADNRPYRLLVAEDAPENRELLVNILKQLGFEIRVVVNGQEAVDVWQAWRPHLIFMDMHMPGLDGYAATRAIKAMPGSEATVIVAITASALEDERQQMLAEGCDGVVNKPFHQHEIEELLVKLLGVRLVHEAATITPPTTGPGPGLDLTGLPADWIAALRQAAIEADGDRLAALAENIREHRPALATALREAASDYNYTAILAAIPAP